MRQYSDPSLPNKIHQPVTAPTEADYERTLEGRVQKMALLRRRQERREEYVKWLKKNDPLLDAMGRWVTGDVIRAQPDPTLRLRRRHYLAQKWREFMYKKSVI